MPTRFDLGRVRTLSIDEVLEVVGEVSLRHPGLNRAAQSLQEDPYGSSLGRETVADAQGDSL